VFSTQQHASFHVLISSKQDVPTHLQHGGTQLPAFRHICAEGINTCANIQAKAHKYEITTFYTCAVIKTTYPELFTRIRFAATLILKKILPEEMNRLFEEKPVIKTCHYLKMFFPSQHVDTWSFDVFALNEASGDHSLKFIFYELLTRYDLISRFKVKPQG